MNNSIREYFEEINSEPHTEVVQSMCRLSYSAGTTVGTLKALVIFLVVFPITYVMIENIIAGITYLIVAVIFWVSVERYIEHAAIKHFIPMFMTNKIKKTYDELMSFIKIDKAVE